MFKENLYLDISYTEHTGNQAFIMLERFTGEALFGKSVTYYGKLTLFKPRLSLQVLPFLDLSPSL